MSGCLQFTPIPAIRIGDSFAQLTLADFDFLPNFKPDCNLNPSFGINFYY